MNNRILTSILFANIFSIPYFFVGNSYEFAYKSASSVYSSYIVLLIFISLIFYIFFLGTTLFFKRKTILVLEIFSIFFSIFVVKAFIYTSTFPTFSIFLSKFGISFDGAVNKVIVLSGIIILFSVLSFLFKKAGNSLFGFYHFYSVVLIIITFYYYIFEKPIVYSVNKHEVSEIFYEPTNIPDKRVIFVIFDELDNNLTFNGTENLKNFRKLKSTSVFANNIYSPSNSTLRTIPHLLTGEKKLIIDAAKRKREIKIIKLLNEKDQDRINQSSNFINDGFRSSFENLDKEEFIMNFENTIFGKIPGGERSSFIIGKYFSYCLIFSKIECRDDKNYEMDLSSTMMLKLFINDYLRKFKIEKRIELKQEDMFMINWQMNILEDVVERFDKSFLFLHLHPPHIPNILYEKNRKDYAMKIYNERLQIADAALGKILKVLDQSPKNQDYLLIVTSDHSFRIFNEMRPIPFLVKVKGVNKTIEINNKAQNSISYNLISSFFNDEIKNHKDIQNKIISSITK